MDVTNNFLYTGAGFSGDQYLLQYNLVTTVEAEVQTETDAASGVMGLAVDPLTGYVYISTGRQNSSGGDHLVIYDSSLAELFRMDTGYVRAAGIAIPGRDISYNPLHLSKAVAGQIDAAVQPEPECVVSGDVVTYIICFDNVGNEGAVTGVVLVDSLPDDVTFLSASSNGVYDACDHSCTWLSKPLPPGGQPPCLQLTVQIDPSAQPGEIIINSVTIYSNETPPTTKTAEVQMCEFEEPIKGELVIEPHMMNLQDCFCPNKLTAKLWLPPSVSIKEVDGPVFLMPGHIPAEAQMVYQSCYARVCIVAVFNKFDLLDFLDVGMFEVVVHGFLRSEQEFTSSDCIKVVDWECLCPPQ